MRRWWIPLSLSAVLAALSMGGCEMKCETEEKTAADKVSDAIEDVVDEVDDDPGEVKVRVREIDKP